MRMMLRKRCYLFIPSNQLSVKSYVHFYQLKYNLIYSKFKDDWRWTYWRLWSKMRKCALLKISSLLQQRMWLFLLLVWLKPSSQPNVNTNENQWQKLKTGVKKQLPRLRRESKETLQRINYVKLVICVKLMDLSILLLQVRMVI